MTIVRPMYRDLAIAGIVQFLAMVFAALILDLGQFASATAYLSIAYWIGVALILSRRSKALTAGDRLYIRFGLIPILIFGVPIFFHVWMIKRVM